MGKGDRRSKKGKIWRGTFGKYRPTTENEEPQPESEMKNKPAGKKAAKKAKAKK